MKEEHRPTIGFNRPAVVWKKRTKPAEDWKSVDVDNTAVGPCFCVVVVRFPNGGRWVFGGFGIGSATRQARGTDFVFV